MEEDVATDRRNPAYAITRQEPPRFCRGGASPPVTGCRRAMIGWPSVPDGESSRWAGGDLAIAMGEPAGGTPLFLFHDETGSAGYARSLTRHLSGTTAVFPLPGFAGPESGLRTIEGFALRLARMVVDVQPGGPYRLAGWSLGGILAYEVAGLLLGRDESVEFLGLIHGPGHPLDAPSEGAFDARDELALRLKAATGPAGDARFTELAAAARGLDFETLVARCRDASFLPDQATPAEVRSWLETRWIHHQAARGYDPPPLPVTVHLFTAEEGGDASPWREWGVAKPKAAVRKIHVPAGASPLCIPELGALGEALAGEIRRAGGSKAIRLEERLSPVFPLRSRGSGAPLFCIPGAGASVVGLAELAACLAPGSPVHGLEPRGMDGASVPHTTVAAAAEYYLANIGEATGAGPIHLLGHSFGGWVALEMALRLLAAGRRVASLSLIDSPVPDLEDSIIHEYDREEAFLTYLEILELAAERSFEIDPEQVRTLDQEARLRLLHGRMVRFGLVPARSAPDMLKGSFRVFSACLRATYPPSAVYPHPADLVLLRDPRLSLEADQLRASEAARDWRRWLPNARVAVGPGNHMTALKRPHVEQLAALLPLES
jgi:arthrofactin-type cyclic lipopeptide synthetase C